MRSRSNSDIRLDYRRIVFRCILERQNPVSFLTTNNLDHSLVRDNLLHHLIALYGLQEEHRLGRGSQAAIRSRPAAGRDRLSVRRTVHANRFTTRSSPILGRLDCRVKEADRRTVSQPPQVLGQMIKI